MMAPNSGMTAKEVGNTQQSRDGGGGGERRKRKCLNMMDGNGSSMPATKSISVHVRLEVQIGKH